jgi:hypothetical protein
MTVFALQEGFSCFPEGQFLPTAEAGGGGAQRGAGPRAAEEQERLLR